MGQKKNWKKKYKNKARLLNQRDCSYIFQMTKTTRYSKLLRAGQSTRDGLATRFWAIITRIKSKKVTKMTKKRLSQRKMS